MNFIKGELEGLFEILPRVFEDERGFFFESYSKKVFEENGLNENFVQDNQSYSIPGVLRGLHFQNPPFAQGKLVSVLKGRVLDVAVDIRKRSPTFGKYQLFEIDDKKKNMVYIPAGFAHGFLAIEESIFCYKCTNLYNKQSEGGIRWDDPEINIQWGIKNPVVSSKDLDLPTFSQLIKALD
jgi:dTDP-4-dehydrorhamnose 3,5-epimerase